jgi:hypothetical protein
MEFEKTTNSLAGKAVLLVFSVEVAVGGSAD